MLKFDACFPTQNGFKSLKKKLLKEFSEEMLTTDENVLFCKLCEIKINSLKKNDAGRKFVS